MNARKKLRLDPDVLRVDSFETASRNDAQGTVHGHRAYTVPLELCSTKCPDDPGSAETTLPCNESLDCDTNRCN